MIQFTFVADELPRQADFERFARERLAALEAVHGAFGACEATIATWHRRNAPGRVFHARISVSVDGRNGRATATCIQDDARRALDGALATLERQLAQGSDAPVDRSGHVVELLPEHGFGVIVTDSGLKVPVHRRGAQDRVFERLHLGDRVWFVPENDAGRSGARIVHVA